MTHLEDADKVNKTHAHWAFFIPPTWKNIGTRAVPRALPMLCLFWIMKDSPTLERNKYHTTFSTRYLKKNIPIRTIQGKVLIARPPALVSGVNMPFAQTTHIHYYILYIDPIFQCNILIITRYYQRTKQGSYVRQKQHQISHPSYVSKF